MNFWSEARAGADFFIAVTFFLLACAGLTVYEAWALRGGHEPITFKVRAFTKSVPWFVMLIVFALGYLAGHLFNPR